MGRTEKKLRREEGETREDEEINQRQANKNANKSLFCTAGRSHGGAGGWGWCRAGWGPVSKFLMPDIVL